MRRLAERLRRCGWLKRTVDISCNIVLICSGLLAGWIVLLLTTFASFRIPTSSMEPVIHPGDRVFVNKWAMGGRIFDIFAALNGEPYRIRRLPGFSRLHRGDLIAFNYPYLNGFDSIKMDPATYYLKRCVGLPGDTLEISECRYIINGSRENLGDPGAQRRLNEAINRYAGEDSKLAPPFSMKAYPQTETTTWTIQNLGPLVIPQKGLTIALTEENFDLYRRAIHWETSMQPVLTPDRHIVLGTDTIEAYTFRENYYFAAGDNCADSHDSRYFGFIPESFIVGKASFKITKHFSIDPIYI